MGEAYFLMYCIFLRGSWESVVFECFRTDRTYTQYDLQENEIFCGERLSFLDKYLNFLFMIIF